MSRSLFHTKTNLPEEDVINIAAKILVEDGYHQVERKGEIVWKKGTGALTAMHFIKLEYYPEDLVVSGWVQIGVGSVGFDDMDLKGFTGSIPKKSTFKTIQKIRKALM